MPIVNSVIKSQVLALLNSTKTMELEQSQQQFAQGMADIIEAALKSATVTIVPGIAVQVAVPAGSGATIAIGTGSLT